ncbi:hypothetical protein HPP92_012489 [Vanilla planifolia]|uniref:Uncharacterized protein n=1 Tax=Vanilla planifolia TaxID=51239 RepID=A0A835V3D8_VANPL|nr:hypothetical protein HPP92_012489 [Vanilla planifolia]
MKPLATGGAEFEGLAQGFNDMDFKLLAMIADAASIAPMHGNGRVVCVPVHVKEIQSSAGVWENLLHERGLSMFKGRPHRLQSREGQRITKSNRWLWCLKGEVLLE